MQFDLFPIRPSFLTQRHGPSMFTCLGSKMSRSLVYPDLPFENLTTMSPKVIRVLTMIGFLLPDTDELSLPVC